MNGLMFLWPTLLWGLLLIPLFAAGFAWSTRRRVRPSVAFPALDAVAAAGPGARRRRLVPAGLFLGALAAVVLALARPVIPMPQPVNRSAVMLSIDVSGSMLSEDIAPSRLEAAKAAAKGFVTGLPRAIPVGLVTFAGDTVLVSAPTLDHERLLRAIDGITVRHRTAIGEGLLAAVAALPERTLPPHGDGALPPAPLTRKAPGVVVLLSDGQNNSGIDPLEAAEWARRQQVRVYTVGIGRPLGSSGGFMIGGPLDEATLQAVAQHTGGTYHHASSAGALREIYRTLGRSVGWAATPVEVTGVLSVVAAAALLAAVLLAVRTQPLIG